MLPKEGELRLEREEDLLLLPRQQAVALEVDGQVRRQQRLPRRPQPPPAFGMRLEDAGGNRPQDRMPRQLPQAGQSLVGRHMGQSPLRRLRDILFHLPADPEKARRLRAVQHEPQKEAQRKIQHARGRRREVADGREVRPLRMQVAKAARLSEVLPIHGPRRGQQEEVPLFRRGAFDVRVEERPGEGDRLLRIRPQGAPDRQRERVLRRGLQRRGEPIRPQIPQRPGAVFGRPRDPPPIHKAEDARAQRKGREKPQDRPGEVLPDPEILFLGRPQKTGESLDGPIQFDP